MEVLVGHPVFASNCKRVGYERLLRSVRNFGAIGIEDHCEDNNAASDHLPDISVCTQMNTCRQIEAASFCWSFFRVGAGLLRETVRQGVDVSLAICTRVARPEKQCLGCFVLFDDFMSYGHYTALFGILLPKNSASAKGLPTYIFVE
jgi:hypothetical protein